MIDTGLVDWPQALVRELADKRCVIVVGAGLSRDSLATKEPGGVFPAKLIGAPGLGFIAERRPPLWVEFVNYCAKRMELVGALSESQSVVAIAATGALLDACEVAKECLEQHKLWVPALEECFKTPGYEAGVLVEHVFRLDQRTVLSFNVDSIYQNYATKVTSGTTHKLDYDSDELAAKIRGRLPLVVSWHGSIEQPRKTIFTRSDYVRLRVRHSAFYGLLSSLYATHTFLFVGCGPSDPDLRLFLENLGASNEAAPFHYFVSAEGDIDRAMDGAYRRIYNIEILRYDPVDEHGRLAQSLAGLVDAIDGTPE